MSKYLNGKIYKLHSYDNELIYIGSTIQALSQRYAGHKINFKKNRDGITSKILFENSENVIITLIKLFPCNCKSELEAEERLYIQNCECVNKIIPTRTIKEYNQDNKEIITKRKQIYYQQNKEVISEKNKIYRQNNKDGVAEKQQIYYQQNKEKLLEKHQIYYQQNKEVIAEKQQIYQQNNKEVLADRKRIYQQNNKERMRIYQQNNKENIKHYDYWRHHKDLFDTIKPLFYDI